MRLAIAFLTDPLVHILLVAAFLVAYTGYRATESQSLAFTPQEAKAQAALVARHRMVSLAGKPRSLLDSREASR